ALPRHLEIAIPRSVRPLICEGEPLERVAIVSMQFVSVGCFEEQRVRTLREHFTVRTADLIHVSPLTSEASMEPDDHEKPYRNHEDRVRDRAERSRPGVDVGEGISGEG